MRVCKELRILSCKTRHEEEIGNLLEAAFLAARRQRREEAAAASAMLLAGFVSATAFTPRPYVPASSAARLGAMSATSRPTFAVRMNDSGAEKQRGGEDEAAPEDLLASFASSVEANVGSASVRDVQLKAMRDDTGKVVGGVGASINKALDLDGKAGAENYPGQVGTPGGILEVGGWRATVAFGLLTVLLAVYAAFTTDFGDGGDELAPQQLCTGDPKLCTRKEIENSKIAEIANRNREDLRARY